MAIIVSFLSQKGGVGKSTLARALAAVTAHAFHVRLADLDTRQGTASDWQARRLTDPARSTCEVVGYANLEDALAASGDVDLLICDAPAGQPRPRSRSPKPPISSSNRRDQAPTTSGLPFCFSMSWSRLAFPVSGSSSPSVAR